MKGIAGTAGAHRWAVVLAGGDGKRLLPVTRRLTGEDRPKQFCALDGNTTLLRQTLDRISGLVEPHRALVVLTRAHERYYREQLSEMPPSRLLVQPQNKGTTAAIVYSLMRVRAADARAVVAILPSDHHFQNVARFRRHLDRAFALAEAGSGRVILLGIVAANPDASYGWIEPGLALQARRCVGISRVLRFWEKPSNAQAAELMQHGCLWNSFVMVGRVDAYLALARKARPDLYSRFQVLERWLFTASEDAVLAELYDSISASGFSEDVLAANPRRLAVLRSDGLGWTDVGEPARLMSVLSRKKLHPAHHVLFDQPFCVRAETSGDGTSTHADGDVVANVA